MKLRKGFIYSIPLPEFSFQKTEIIKEFEEIARTELNDPNFTLSPKIALSFQMGYEFGLIDGRMGVVE